MNTTYDINTFSEENRKYAQQILERLELMRSLKDKPVDECRALADETFETFAPKAEELGMGHEQSELQELAMKYGYPDDYKELKRLLQDAEAMCQITFKTFTLPLHSLLTAAGIKYRLEYRMKSVYSIWRKMRVDNKHFDDVYDLFASRIIYTPTSETPDYIDAETLDCWRIYNIITSLYRIHPDRIRDWVTHPKPSGYQAVQVTAMGPDCTWIEIQIRSERMNDMAENGIAAHWRYKQETAVK